MLQILKSNGKTDGSVIFNSVSKGNKFNINSKTYTFNGSKLK